MKDERIKKEGKVPVAAHVLAIVGLSVCTITWLLCLREWLPTLASRYGSAVFRVLACSFDDAVGVLIYFPLTIALLTASERIVSRGMGPKRFAHVYSTYTTLCFALLLFATLLIMIKDYPHRLYWLCGIGIYRWFFIVSPLTLASGMFSIALYRLFRRAVYLAVFAVLPLLSSLILSLPTLQRELEEEYDYFRWPAFYPRMIWVASVIVILIVVFVLLSRKWRKRTRNEVSYPVTLTSVGLWGWVLFSLVGLALAEANRVVDIVSFNYSIRFMIPDREMIWAIGFFLSLWVIIIIVQLTRYLRRAKMNRGGDR